LQGVYDHRRRFLDVCVRVLGGCHNAAHLRSSSLWQKIQSDTLLHKQLCKINNKDVQPYLLGDAVYPLRVGLLKCFNARATGTAERDQFDHNWRAG
jgi:hypothetical protein